MADSWRNTAETYRFEKQTFDGNSTASSATELIDARGYRLARIHSPSNLTAAKFQVHETLDSDGTPVAIQDDILGTPIALTATASKATGIKEYIAPLSGLGFIRLVSVAVADGTTLVGQVGTKGSVVLTPEATKTLTFASGVGGAASNGITITLEVAQDDTLAVSASGKAILIKLANKTASKNAAGAIQTAIRALTITGITMTGFTVTANAAYTSAPVTGALVGTKASLVADFGSSKTLTIGSGYAGSWYNDLSFAFEVAENDTLAVAESEGVVTVKLAQKTGSKNTAAAIQAAVRGLTVSGLNMDAFTVTGSTAYDAAPVTGASVGTPASVVLTTETGKTLTIGSGLAGSLYNDLSFAVATAADDNLAVAEADGTITISLANGTASKNTAANIQTAVRALAVSGYDMTAFAVTANAAYTAAPSIASTVEATAMAGGSEAVLAAAPMALGDEDVVAATALTGGADTIVKVVLVA